MIVCNISIFFGCQEENIVKQVFFSIDIECDQTFVGDEALKSHITHYYTFIVIA
jgi:hypothetical protein